MLPPDKYRQFRIARAIRERCADGEPLGGRDLQFVAGLLR